MTTSRLGPPRSALERAWLPSARGRLAELARFGSVGAVAYVVDLGLFNLLRFGPGELLIHKPLTAKVISVAVATLVAWLGNRYWTFSSRRTSSPRRELAGFVVVNLGGLVIGVGCLAFSHYALNLTSPLADNISANVVGLALGTAFRYVFYRRLVFTGTSPVALASPALERRSFPN
ncbi:GtrA family protein [Pengzhenrongella frigida]|uniref:GtrA family protein n=1 Tax=Pengzhenrongella frigida TaxID=1259133 RepID=A0A4Q5N017_9MICO|nr:GtrA family protein [Cellulomonas sp. HLT2-17]RYV51350.1 GtrA family protein [Cellulomonas sp. HLT2-17]